MKSKTQQIREAMAAGDQIGALRLSARFFDRSVDTMIFKRAMGAYRHPGFYRQLGQDPDQIIGVALQTLVRRFDLEAGNRFVAAPTNGMSFDRPGAR